MSLNQGTCGLRSEVYNELKETSRVLILIVEDSIETAFVQL